MNLKEVTEGANNLAPLNEDLLLLDWSTTFGNDPETTSGLTWGYFGTPVSGIVTGYWGGNTTAAGTASLTDNNTTYQVAARATGVVSFSTSNTNWNDTTNYARCYRITTVSGAVTAVQDHRAGKYGICSGVDGTNGSTSGRHSVPVMAGAMQPSVSGGCAALAAVASAANQPDIITLNFDKDTVEYAQFSIPMMKSWNEGTITFKPIWSHAAASAYVVIWSLQAIALSNDDAIAQNFGTAQTSTDTGGTTNDIYVGPESSAITIAGTPADEDVVHFRISRVATDGGDTLDVDARLHGIILYITTNAENDA